MKNKSYLIGFILNLLCALLASVGLIIQLVETPTGAIFQYYTILSNTFCVIISTLISIFYGINTFIKPVKIPKVIQVMRYVDVTMLLVTFLTVVFFLSWSIEEYTFLELLSKGSMLYHHTLVPLIAIVSFIFYEKNDLKKLIYTFIPSFVSIVYAVPFMILDGFHVMRAPYPFLGVGGHPWWYCTLISLGVILFIYGGAFILRLLNKHFSIIKE